MRRHNTDCSVSPGESEPMWCIVRESEGRRSNFQHGTVLFILATECSQSTPLWPSAPSQTRAPPHNHTPPSHLSIVYDTATKLPFGPLPALPPLLFMNLVRHCKKLISQLQPSSLFRPPSLSPHHTTHFPTLSPKSQPPVLFPRHHSHFYPAALSLPISALLSPCCINSVHSFVRPSFKRREYKIPHRISTGSFKIHRQSSSFTVDVLALRTWPINLSTNLESSLRRL